MTENERVKELRKARDLTLEKFGQRLGVGKTAISKIERGENAVTDQMRRSICREFGVREEWLRDGEGAMEAAQDTVSIDELVARLSLGPEEHASVVQLVSKYFELSPETRQDIMRVFLSGQKTSTPEQRARSRANDFYEEALAEEKAVDESSASPPTGAKEA